MQATVSSQASPGQVAAPPLARPGLLAQMRRGRFTRHLPAMLSWAIGLCVWEILGRTSSPFIFASFSETMVALWNLTTSGVLLHHTTVSLFELAIGFLLGALFGLAGGLAAGFSRLCREMTEHWITVSLAMPFAAVFPMFLVWFGLGPASKIALAVFASFIPVWMNTRGGIASVDRQLVEMTRAFGGKWRHVVRSIIMPWSLPSIMDGLRMGLGRAFLAVVVGELLAAREGLGFLISLSGQTLRMDNLLAAVVVVTGITVVLSGVMRVVQRAVVPWWEERD